MNKVYGDCTVCNLIKYCQEDDWDLCFWRPDPKFPNKTWENHLKYIQSEKDENVND